MSIDRLPAAPKQSAIADFPTELLLLIFRFIYLSTSIPCNMRLGGGACHVCVHLSPKEHRIWPENIMNSPDALFPYAPASVCRHWRVVLSAEPEFWTRLVVFIDSEPTDVKSHLKWSSPLPVHAVIKRKEESRQLVSTATEKSRVDAILRIISPEIDRFHHLWVVGVHRDSIPSAINEIGISSRMLESILLEPDPHTISEELDVTYDITDTTNIEVFHCPNVSSAIIDGRNFNILNHYRGGVSKTFPALQTLIINGGDFSKKSAIDPLSVIHHMKRVLYLHLRKLKLHPKKPNYQLAGEYIKLEELSADTVQTFLQRTIMPQLDTLEISSCKIHSTQELPDCWTISYSRILPLSGNSEFGNLGIWRGTELKFSNCDGFNDEFLNMLGSPVGGIFPCINIRKLIVENCENFTIEALKEMLEARNKLIPGPPIPGTPNLDVAVLDLTVVASYTLSEEDKQWFSERLRAFEWVQS